MAGSDADFRQLLEKLPAAAYTCDAEGLITYFNRRAVQLWGRKPALNSPADRFCGSFQLFSTSGELIQHNQCWMAKAIHQNREYNGEEIVVERPDGSRRNALAHANPVHNDTGSIIGAINVLIDITDQKQREQELRTRSRQLQRLAIQLTQTEQRERRKLAEVLHDNLQQLLVAIDFQASATDANADSVLIADALQRIRGTSQEALEVCRSLTARSVPDCLVEDGIVAAIRWLGAWMKNHFGLKVHVGAAKELSIRNEALRAFLFESVRELLFNVVKYAKADEAWVSVAVVADATIQITVRDHGIGFTTDLESESARESLGLRRIRERSQRFGGRTEITSSPGKGTTVLMRAPYIS